MSRSIRSTAALLEALPRLAGAGTLALDTEFHTERRYLPELMLVQLRADDEEPILVDPLAPVDMRALASTLVAAPVVVHGGQQDVALLERATGARANVVFDTQVAAGCAGQGYPARLQELVARNLSLPLDKTWTLSDWSRRPLSPAQLEYAAEDVLVLGRLRDAIRSELTRRGTGPVARACTEELLALATAPDVDDEAWKTVNGAHLLDGAESAALQALAAWRQKEARSREVPRHNVLSDALLLDLARRRPATAEALRANRRFPSAVWKKDGEALLDQIRSAEGGGVEPLVRWPRPWADLVRAAARVVEVETGVAVELLLPDRALTALWTNGVLAPWRREALGPGFFDFLQGRTSIFMPAPLRVFTDS